MTALPTCVDTRFDAVVDRHVLRSLLAALPARERQILALRYVDDMSQHEIAARVGVSQMHVSRLLGHVPTASASPPGAQISTSPAPTR